MIDQISPAKPINEMAAPAQIKISKIDREALSMPRGLSEFHTRGKSSLRGVRLGDTQGADHSPYRTPPHER